MSVEEDQQYLEDGSGNPEFVADVSLVEEEKPYEFKHRETTFFPPGRVKKIMLADQEVGKIKKETPSLLGMCVEMFIEHLIASAAAEARADSASLVSAGHFKRAVKRNTKWDFLYGLVDKIADLPENVESDKPKKPRKKKVNNDDGESAPPAERKPTVKRSGGTAKRAGKKAEEEIAPEAAMETDEVPAEAPTSEVFVQVSISAVSASDPVGPVVQIAADEDDFDA